MFERAPREREAVSWGYALFWAALIFVTAPYVRVGVDFVRQYWTQGFFTYAVVALVVLATASALYTTRARWTLSSCLWLLGLSALIIYLTFGLADANAVEAVHFVQYGTLSLLLFRAFSHRVRDYSIYAAATIAGTFVGMIDETVQWLAPGRVFDVKDIWLNLKAVAVVQIGLAAGIRPKVISGLPGWDSLRRLCYLSAVTIGYLGLCLQNTSDRISWYADNVPGLGFINPSENVMVEYGHLLGDPATVTFRSRLSLEDLRQSASRHAENGAHNLDHIHEREQLGSYWDAHPRFSHLYLYEGRIHQLRRDQFLKRAERSNEDDKRAQYLAAAHWENTILKDYFSVLLVGTRFEWSPEMEAQVRDGADLTASFESNVSGHLIVAYSRHQLALLCSALVIGFLLIAYVCGRASRQANT